MIQRLLLLLQVLLSSYASAFHVGIYATKRARKNRQHGPALPSAEFSSSVQVTITRTTFTAAASKSKDNGHDAIATLIVDQTETAKEAKAKDEKKKSEDSQADDYEMRRALWEDRYGSVEALRRTFGRSKYKLWGDLDPESTRQLYHTLLPRSLLGLYEAGLMKPDELAPLAYQARKAAKEYARERSTLPGRLVAQAFDGFRSLKRNGTFEPKGISWEELWDKYEGQIVEEECRACIDNGDRTCRVDQEALADRIYLRILERSCATNQAFDRLLRKPSKRKRQKQKQKQKDHFNLQQQQQQQATDSDSDSDIDDEDDPYELPPLDTISKQLESDVRDILLNPKEAKKAVKFDIKEEKRRWKMEKKRQKAIAKKQEEAEKAAMKLEEAFEKQKRKVKKLEKKRQKALQKALQTAAEKHQQRQKEEEKEETEDDDTIATAASPGTSSHSHSRGRGRTSSIVKEFDSSKTEDRVRRAYPVLRIMAKTRRLLQS